jgi:hypothetical protein
MRSARSAIAFFTIRHRCLEVELAARSGIGWRGKHTLALDRQGGSMFFLGEIYVDLARRRRRRSRRTAAAAAPASTSARPGRSSARTGSTRGAASPT